MIQEILKSSALAAKRFQADGAILSTEGGSRGFDEFEESIHKLSGVKTSMKAA